MVYQAVSQMELLVRQKEERKGKVHGDYGDGLSAAMRICSQLSNQFHFGSIFPAFFFETPGPKTVRPACNWACVNRT